MSPDHSHKMTPSQTTPASRQATDPRSIAGRLIIPAREPGMVQLTPGTIHLRDGLIESVEPKIDQHADLGGNDFIISPGFVDAHVHLPQFDCIGIDGLELLDWLQRVIFPAEARWADEQFATQMCSNVARQMLSFGTTAIAAYGTVHHASSQSAIRVMSEAGLAGCVGQVLMDRNAPPELLRPADQLLDEAARLVPVGRVVPAITPRFAISCTPQLLNGCGSLAAARPWPVQTHLAETDAELRAIAELFNGVPYTQVYKHSGLLTPRTLLAHAIHLSPDDRRCIADAQSIVAHCPTANLFLNAGKMDLSATIGANMRLSIGSDVAGGPDRSMVRVARCMLETAKRLDHRPPSAAQAWYSITARNADELALACGHRPGALGGRLVPGTAADLLVLRPDLRLNHSPDPLAALLYAWDDRWIHHTLTAGRIRFSRDPR